jgi:hypothetical protein
MVAPDAAKNALCGLRSKHTDEEENNNRHENPKFDQARPEKPRDIHKSPAAIPIFSGDIFRRYAHGHYDFCRVRIRCATMSGKSLVGSILLWE